MSLSCFQATTLVSERMLLHWKKGNVTSFAGALQSCLNDLPNGELSPGEKTMKTDLLALLIRVPKTFKVGRINH